MPSNGNLSWQVGKSKFEGEIKAEKEKHKFFDQKFDFESDFVHKICISNNYLASITCSDLLMG